MVRSTMSDQPAEPLLYVFYIEYICLLKIYEKHILALRFCFYQPEQSGGRNRDVCQPAPEWCLIHRKSYQIRNSN